MAFEYDMYILMRKDYRYMHRVICADTFHEAFFRFLDSSRNRDELVQSRLVAYCRRKSRDMQWMGVYQGGYSATGADGESCFNVLYAADGKSYMLAEGRFERVFIESRADQLMAMDNYILD